MSLSIGAYRALAGAALGAAASAATSPATVPAVDASAMARDSGAASAVSDFLNYANETPAQRMRDAVLKSLGLSEADLKAMSPEKRKAIEETIRERIKEAAEQAAQKGKTGLVADVKA